MSRAEENGRQGGVRVTPVSTSWRAPLTSFINCDRVADFYTFESDGTVRSDSVQQCETPAQRYCVGRLATGWDAPRPLITRRSRVPDSALTPVERLPSRAPQTASAELMPAWMARLVCDQFARRLQAHIVGAFIQPVVAASIPTAGSGLTRRISPRRIRRPRLRRPKLCCRDRRTTP